MWRDLPTLTSHDGVQDSAVVLTTQHYGADALSPLAFLAAHISRIKPATGVVQIDARTPVATAMHVMTIDALAGGSRTVLGLGVCGVTPLRQQPRRLVGGSRTIVGLVVCGVTPLRQHPRRLVGGSRTVLGLGFGGRAAIRSGQ